MFPPPPRGTRAPAERGSPGAACQLPSRPTLPWARPRSLAGGQHPHYRCQARELEQRAGGAGPGHRWGGVPPGVPGQGGWEGSVPELAGAVEFSRVSDGRSDPRQPPRACWTTGSWSSPALARRHTCWPHSAQPGPHLAKLLSTVPDPSPLPRGCPALAVLEGSRLYSVLGLRVPVSSVAQRSGTRCPPTLCSGGRPLAWDPSISRPRTGVQEGRVTTGSQASTADLDPTPAGNQSHRKQGSVRPPAARSQNARHSGQLGRQRSGMLEPGLAAEARALPRGAATAPLSPRALCPPGTAPAWGRGACLIPLRVTRVLTTLPLAGCLLRDLASGQND